MGNRAKNIGKRKKHDEFLLKTVNLGKQDSYVVQVYQYLIKKGILGSDDFSEWIRECIIFRYPRTMHGSFEANALFQRSLLITEQIKDLASQRIEIESKLDSLGFRPDYIDRVLDKIPNIPCEEKTTVSDNCKKSCSDKECINKKHY